MKAKVYFNLNNHKWSIKSCETGLVVGHADKVSLHNVEPMVSQAGRLRVLREKVKNVHAYLVGEVAHVENFTPLRGRWIEAFHDCFPHENVTGEVITYNPYKFETFVSANNLKPIKRIGIVDMVADRKCIGFGVSYA
jgi:hypothetical protein